MKLIEFIPTPNKPGFECRMYYHNGKYLVFYDIHEDSEILDEDKATIHSTYEEAFDAMKGIKE